MQQLQLLLVAAFTWGEKDSNLEVLSLECIMETFGLQDSNDCTLGRLCEDIQPCSANDF